MEQIRHAINEMINVSETEMVELLSKCNQSTFRKNEIVCRYNTVPNEVLFINKGIVRVYVTDNSGIDHTIHFALENQFIADYTSFLLKQPSVYTLQAIEPLDVVVMPRETIMWGYEHLKEGNKLGRLIAEFYFIYQDARIRNAYTRTPKERYDDIVNVFPNIHNRVPQHMIASYLGITPVHLSRLKKSGE